MAEESVKVPIDGDSSGFDKEVEGMKGTISAASVAMGNLLADLGKKHCLHSEIWYLPAMSLIRQSTKWQHLPERLVQNWKACGTL